MELIESYGPGDDIFEAYGRSFPVPSLVEDADGLRWYLCSTEAEVPAAQWAEALAGGAVGLLVGMGGYVAALTSEAFMAARTDLHQRYSVPEGAWLHFAEPPTYRQLLLYKAPERKGGFVHLHNHSEFSSLDGLSSMSEIMSAVSAADQSAVAITDHGTCAGHPELQKVADKAGIKPIFGIEAYFVDDRITRPAAGDVESQKALKDYFHLILWASNDEGLRNLWAMSTQSAMDGFYYRPRMDWATLASHSGGIIASTACLRGPLARGALLDDREDVARARLGRLLDVYGDRLYIEMHANQLPEQIKLNHALVSLSKDYGVPMVAAVDSHYPKASDAHAHRAWLSIQTNSDISDDGTLFAGGQDYSIQSEEQIRKSLSYLGDAVVSECMTNTVSVADLCDATVSRKSSTPIFTKGVGAGHVKDAERLLDLCIDAWSKTEGKSQSQSSYMARFEREFGLLKSKSFCGYFLMWSDICLEAKRRGILVGPGRGSGGGSLVAYLAGITDIDPVDADLLFERFLTEGRTSLPDFDVDFPQSKKQEMQQYTIGKYGEDHVAVVGSVLRLRSKGVIQKLGMAMRSTLPDTFFADSKKIGAIIDEAEADSAGLGIAWEDLWIQNEALLEPYRSRYPELFALADQLVGRVHTYGQHAAGLIISTEDSLAGSLPMRRASGEGHPVVQFDFRTLEDLGYVKFDVLTLRNLDTIQNTIDLIKARRGVDIDVYSWRDEYLDPQVWDEISAGHTLGIFQIETALGTQYAKRVKPRNLADLADLVTIVRPGPRNSGLTKIYLERRDGREAVSFPDPRLAEVLAKTYGTMLYQEDIMAACMVLGGYDSNEADEVRKILGKKQVEKVAAAGIEFTSRAVAGGMTVLDADHLWLQMSEFAKYSFNRAHAYGYAMLAFWCAWLKVHYPVEFFTAAMSTVDKDRIPVFIKEARRMGLSVMVPDINESGRGFKAFPQSVRYGLDSVKGIGDAAVEAITSGQPYASWGDFMERKGAKCNAGHIAILARIGAFDSLVPNRRGLEAMLAADKSGVSTECFFKRIEVKGPNGLPCIFDWDTEPDNINPRNGKVIKQKPLPKKCTKACRNYTAPQAMDVNLPEPYTEADIRNIEMDLLGVFLSTTPFDRVTDPSLRKESLLAAEEMAAEKSALGSYRLIAIVNTVRPYTTDAGQSMGFVGLETERQTFDAVVFSKQWLKHHKTLTKGSLAMVEVEKTDRGYTLNDFDLL